MTTRREHYKEAEMLLSEATFAFRKSKGRGYTNAAARLAEANILERAQVHATLAGVSAEVAGEEFRGMPHDRGYVRD